MIYFKGFIRKNVWTDREGFINFGWGNGYVIIPSGSLLHSVPKEDLNKKVCVSGGITYSGLGSLYLPWEEDKVEILDTDWVVGFDTIHPFNSLKEHDRDFVVRETQRLERQLSYLEQTLIENNKFE